jgi:hypothetical protein
MKRRAAKSLGAALVLLLAGFASGAGNWCLGLGVLGPIRTGMSVEEVLRLADFSGMERRRPAEGCWHLSYARKAPEFTLMIIDGRVVRIEIPRTSTVNTYSGVHMGMTEAELKRLFGDRLDVQPHKYDEKGKTMTFRSSDGAFGLRFETSSGLVDSMQSGPWEHLNYVEGCG